MHPLKAIERRDLEISSNEPTDYSAPDEADKSFRARKWSYGPGVNVRDAGMRNMLSRQQSRVTKTEIASREFRPYVLPCDYTRDLRSSNSRDGMTSVSSWGL